MTADTPFQPRRSMIFVAGTHTEMLPKALTAGADMVCIDLEDAVAPQHKNNARVETLALFEQAQADDGVERVVRINPLRTPEGAADLVAICEHGSPPHALMMTKARSPEDVRVVVDLLDAAGHDHVKLHVIIETTGALDSAYEVAQASERLDSLLFGGIDMAAELRVEPTWESLVYARSRAVHAAAGAGIDMIDVPFLDLEDHEGLEQEAAASAALGFTGKAAIHPKQIPVLNTVFSPSLEQVDYARRVIAAFESADTGLVVFEGKLLERPVLRSMYRVVAIAERIGETGTSSSSE